MILTYPKWLIFIAFEPFLIGTYLFFKAFYQPSNFDIVLSNERKQLSRHIIINIYFSFIMPLVVMCGVPGSGKTHRAKQIAVYLQQKHKKKVCIVNEQNLGIQKNAGYKNAQAQKITRGKIKFEAEKNLVGDTVVIVDSSNYIKGYRYQMYCIAREQKTTYCVVFCNTDFDRCRQFNKLNQNRFQEDLQEDFMKRMERPELKNRWDVPLFERREEEPTPIQQITDVLLFQQKKSKDPVSTKQQQKLSEDYLLQLDQLMQQINDQALLGKIKLVNSWSAVQLKKLKKNFTNIAKQKPQSLKVLRQAYLDYLVQADKRK